MTDDTTDTMADVSHTNPYTGETAGRLFTRGPTVAADGGQTDGSGETPTGGTGEKPPARMADVDHTPPHDATDVTRVFERGRDPVETNENEE
ncbi:hypothetical protein [Natrarchaeobaculum aegyptiacum]|uniref:Uncharacterized protein n=1 Tax=Natrarchaeobaculum aegyptiacum TaxID=745377 RepID=A0A2Z2HNT5_9EURY|nr:hypothetical protein [Natrarchaeobaculum aegyptiacum]ARS88636.1 hypothetical protein B1756_01920 [Natrarchaeobaculum aegyptiacum]